MTHDDRCASLLGQGCDCRSPWDAINEAAYYADVTHWLRQHHHINVSGTVTWSWSCQCGKSGPQTTRGRALAGRDRHLLAQRRRVEAGAMRGQR